TGGGVRSAEDVESLLAIGVERVIVGSLAVTEPEQVSRWLERYGPDHITLALDVKRTGGQYRPALSGWTDLMMTTLDDVVKAYDGAGLAHALVTDIGRDGDLSGPNLALYRGLVERFPEVQWQASGGIASLEDIKAARETGVAGAISGKAIYENRFSIQEALACSQGE
ncbi:MAG: HisA/HisF-related TIM barrel protein, partial [Alphaproteobacteria bacterium]|nr:HisA/HisF-related TIM barrel protein [Alphaproteobacteria bacterium]